MADSEREELLVLRRFFKRVAQLTKDHDVIEISDDEGYAVVFPKDLGEELAKVDPNWWKT